MRLPSKSLLTEYNISFNSLYNQFAVHHFDKVFYLFQTEFFNSNILLLYWLQYPFCLLGNSSYGICLYPFILKKSFDIDFLGVDRFTEVNYDQRRYCGYFERLISILTGILNKLVQASVFSFYHCFVSFAAIRGLICVEISFVAFIFYLLI